MFEEKHDQITLRRFVRFVRFASSWFGFSTNLFLDGQPRQHALNHLVPVGPYMVARPFFVGQRQLERLCMRLEFEMAG